MVTQEEVDSVPEDDVEVCPGASTVMCTHIDYLTHMHIHRHTYKHTHMHFKIQYVQFCGCVTELSMNDNQERPILLQ